MTLKTLMDDAAASATRDLRVDVAAVRARAARRRREVRRRAVAVMTTAVAVAATIALAVVLLPGSSPRADVRPAAGTPTGLPDRWFGSPSWIPPVTRHPMPAASMVLNAPVVPRGLRNWGTAPGPVLVSATGKTYAGLPWGEHDNQVTLSADGRHVAWVTQGKGERVVHRIELATGSQRDDRLPTRQEVSQLVWAGGVLWAGVAYDQDSRPSTYVLRPGAKAVRVCLCGSLPLAADAAGNLHQPPPSSPTAGRIPGVPVLTGLGDITFPKPVAPYGRVFSHQAVVSPDGTTTATTSSDGQGRFSLVVGGVAHPLDGVVFAEALAWTPQGILVRVAVMQGAGPVRSLRSYSPEDARSRLVARPAYTADEVGAVAAGLADAAVVPGAPPRFSDTDRSHVHFLLAHGWSAFGQYVKGLVFGLVLLLAGLFWWRTGRRRKTDVRDEPAHAPGGADPAGDGG